MQGPGWSRVAAVVFACALGCAAPGAGGETPTELEEQVRAVERAFAKTMADRDHAAFTGFLADDAVFVGSRALRGRDEVAAGWKPLFEAPEAPFSWEPETVVVPASGTLALSRGPVYDPTGRRVGTFNSTWRREPDGRWKIVLDAGCPPCDCAAGKQSP